MSMQRVDAPNPNIRVARGFRTMGRTAAGAKRSVSDGGQLAATHGARSKLGKIFGRSCVDPDQTGLLTLVDA